MSDGLPAFGIVAAVLGIIVAMGSLGGPPEELGRHVAAALNYVVFYGLVAPIGNKLRSYFTPRPNTTSASRPGSSPSFRAMQWWRSNSRKACTATSVQRFSRSRKAVTKVPPPRRCRGDAADGIKTDAPILIKKIKKSQLRTTPVPAIAYADFATAMMAFFLLLGCSPPRPRSRSLASPASYAHPVHQERHGRQRVQRRANPQETGQLEAPPMTHPDVVLGMSPSDFADEETEEN